MTAIDALNKVLETLDGKYAAASTNEIQVGDSVLEQFFTGQVIAYETARIIVLTLIEDLEEGTIE